jgi:hypothetical protein
MTNLEKYAGLQRLHEFALPIFTSPGLEASARPIAARFTRAHRFFGQMLDRDVQVGLVVLSAEDWARTALFPTYGVTYYDYPNRMVVTGGTSGVFWHSTVELVGTVSVELLQELRAVYGGPDGQIDLTPNVHLWPVHDLGHACNLDIPYGFPRKWLLELFADVCLHTYLAVNEPEQLPVQETLWRVLSNVPAQRFPYRTLHDFEAQYGDGDWTMENYAWYHGHFYESARRLYNALGVGGLQRMWQVFVVANVQEASDVQVADLLGAVDPGLARMIEAWPPRARWHP